LKNTSFLRSSKNRLILLFSLAAAAAVLIIILYLRNDEPGKDETVLNDTLKKTAQNKDTNDSKTNFDVSIDSIFYNFGIKKEWITTEKKTSKAEWFTKSVLIPKDVTSAEINLDISTYLNESGLDTKVTEDILSKNINIYINNPDSSKKLPAAIIQVIHSDKVIRETGVIAIILDKVNDFTPEEIDKIIITKNEFS